jgi:hypothetical protein
VQTGKIDQEAVSSLFMTRGMVVGTTNGRQRCPKIERQRHKEGQDLLALTLLSNPRSGHCRVRAQNPTHFETLGQNTIQLAEP